MITAIKDQITQIIFKGHLNKRYLTGFALLILLFVTIYPRIQTYFLSFSKQLAEKEVYADLANETKDYIKKKYTSSLTVSQEDEYILQEYKKRLKEQKEELSEKIREKIKEKKAYWKDEFNQVYLLEFDPYYLYRYTKNLLKKGTISDRIVEGKLYDTYSYAPKGKFITPSFIIYVGFFFQKIITFFNKDFPLVNTLFFVPLLLSILLTLAVFFFVRKFFGLTVAFFSTLVITLTPIFLSRSMCGWFDNDCFNLLLPCLIIFLFYSAIKESSLKKSFVLIISSALCLGIYALAWNGWWHFFYIILAGSVLYLLNTLESYFKYKETSDFLNLKKTLILLGVFVVLGLGFAAIISAPWRVTQLLKEPFYVFRSVYAKRSFTYSLWPNTFITVAELNPADFKEIIYLAGDPFIFFLSLLGLFLLIKPRAEEDRSLQYLGFVFTVWLFAAILSSLRALRFSLLMAIPQGVCFAVAIKFMINLFSEKIKTLTQKKALIYKAVLLLILVVFIINLFLIRIAPAKYTRPVMNDDYAKVIERIKKESDPQTLINSWWDYGSWYAAFGERRVIFDGTTQQTPVAYWMAKMLLTNDENEAIGILRMLNNGSNDAFEELKKIGLDDLEAIQILQNLIVLDKEKAELYLKERLPQDALKILKYTHAEPPPTYYIIDDHMIEIIGALALLGNWQPEKAFAWQIAHTENNTQKIAEILQKRLNTGLNETYDLYKNASAISNANLKNWASFNLRFYSPLSKGKREGNVVLFDNNVVLDLSDFKTRIKTQGEDSWKRPYSLIYPEGNDFKEIVYEDDEVPFSILLIPEKEGFKNLVLDRDLAKSMLVRLFFLRGQGLKFFRFLFSEKDKEPGNINVWEIDWQGKQQNLFPLDLTTSE